MFAESYSRFVLFIFGLGLILELSLYSGRDLFWDCVYIWFGIYSGIVFLFGSELSLGSCLYYG